jgi:Putative auto-transporter adhesin, head GIN domain
MAKLTGILCFLFLVFTGSAQEKTVINDKNVQTRNLEEFDGISVSGAIELYVSQGKQKVAVSAAEIEKVDELETYVEDRILYIRFKTKKSWWSDQWNTSGRSFRAYVSAEQIKSISLAGSGNIHIEGTLNSPDLDIEISGSGNISGTIITKNLEVTQSGSSNIKLNGEVLNAKFECSGSGNIISPDLKIDVCDVEMSGSGNAEIQVNTALSASISGSGNIRYKGNGNIVSSSTSGSGKIRKI